MLKRLTSDTVCPYYGELLNESFSLFSSSVRISSASGRQEAPGSAPKGNTVRDHRIGRHPNMVITHSKSIDQPGKVANPVLVVSCNRVK